MVKQFSSDLKLKAVNYYNKIKNFKKVCDIFECYHRSLKRWVLKYSKIKDLDRKEREKGSYKIKQIHIDFIKDELRNNNDIHMQLLHQKLHNKFTDLSICRQYLSNIIRDNNITRKRATFEHFPKTYRGKDRNEKEELKAFFNVIKNFNLDDIICIDESSLSTSLKYNYCRNALGDRCIIKTDDNSVFKKYSYISAITNKECINSKLYDEGSVNAERFNIFLTEICNKVKNKLFILDNGQIHKKEETKKIIKNSGNYLLYTCPYHPRLNCIEQWFNQLKHYIKLDKPMSLLKLKESLNNSINKIKEKHYKNYFIYAYKKDLYKNKKMEHISTKHRKPKIYKK